MAKRHRVFALTAALLFLLTSIGFSAFVIYSVHKERNTPNTINDQSTKQGAQLKGTKLENFTPIAKVDQLQSIDIREGTGDEVKPGATVTAHYTGAIASTGVIFQSSHDGANQPIPFKLGEVIAGWSQGVPGMKVGGIRRLIIPAGLAYGAQSPSSDIPPNSDLVFDIELVAVQNP
jgi:FKBP-type peptidyl-prolyl cis-trans isomerase FkpA